MNKSAIHKTDAEKLADASQSTASTLQETNSRLDRANSMLDKLHTAATDKSLEMAGFSGVIDTNQKVARKIDEVKSASLITNKLLKEISMKEAPVAPVAPIAPVEMKMELTNKPNELATAFFSMLKGDKGDTPTEEEITKLIKPLISKIIKGDKGEKGEKGDRYVLSPQDKQKIVEAIPPSVVEIIEVAVADEPDTIVEKIHKAEKKIHPSRVHGLEQTMREVNNYGRNPMGIGGGANALIFQDSTGARISDYVTTLKLSTGLTPSYSNGVITVGATGGSSSSASLTTLTATETPNGVLTVFTFSAATTQPDFIVADGVQLRATSSSGTINWTWNGGTKQATLTIPPTDDIYALVASNFSLLYAEATEIPNGIITVFTFPATSTQPVFLFIDGIQTQATSSSGTVNWTWNTGTKQATLSVPPLDDIYASLSSGFTTTYLTASSFVDNEVVSGSGTSFTLANTPVVGSVHLYGLGQRLTPTTDFTISGTAITTAASYAAGKVLADYRR